MTGGGPVITHSEDETAAVAARLAASLPPGTVVLLVGDLGAGKTAFVRGMAAGLGLDAEDVSSPTFTLVQEYRRPAPDDGPALAGSPRPTTLYHADLYRIEGAEADDLGLDELAAGGALVAIEWAEKLPRPPARAVRVSITEVGEDERAIEVTGADAPAVNEERRT
jgi:tRNA threonylcarbamoyladenosine biosynthesis protein TsaE